MVCDKLGRVRGWRVEVTRRGVSQGPKRRGWAGGPLCCAVGCHEEPPLPAIYHSPSAICHLSSLHTPTHAPLSRPHPTDLTSKLHHLTKPCQNVVSLIFTRPHENLTNTISSPSSPFHILNSPRYCGPNLSGCSVSLLASTTLSGASLPSAEMLPGTLSGW